MTAREMDRLQDEIAENEDSAAGRNGGKMSGTEWTEPWQVWPIHRINGWSSLEKDETPFCGADKNDPKVLGKRTVYQGAVTCPKCIDIQRIATCEVK